MASVTKNLGFAITTSSSYEAPYIVAKRFSTLDHLTGGRFGWNIVTSWKESASKAVRQTLAAVDDLADSSRLDCPSLITINAMRLRMNT